MKRGYYYLLYIVIISISLLSSFFVFSSSIWFLRGVLGSQQGVVEFGYQPSDEATKKVAGDIINFGQRAVGVIDSHYFRVLYLQDRSQEYIIGIPTLRHQLSEGKELEKNGWKVVRIGWIVNAYRPINDSTEYQRAIFPQRQISILEGIKEEFKAIFIHHLPVSPIIIARSIPSFLSVDTAIDAYGVDEKGALHVVAQYDGLPLKVSQRSITSLGGVPTNDMYVAIQSDVLKKISNQLIGAINESVARGAHFTKTSPDIISAFPSSAQVSFLLHDNRWAIGVGNNSDVFKNNLIQFMKAEQGARHPVRKGFQLPDGTIGHEYVASSPTITFSPITENSDCQKSIGYDEQFFVCLTQDKITFSTDQSEAESLLRGMVSENGMIKGSISNTVMKNLFPHSDLEAMTFLGDSHSSDIWISTR